MARKVIKVTDEQAASALIKALLRYMQQEDIDIEGPNGEMLLTTDASKIHFHDGSDAPIAFNDVQAIKSYNDHFLNDGSPKMPVPDTPTEGYNQHHHTSEFDGGFIPGAQGIHDHRDNDHGGFAFAVFHPATDVPQAPWEN
jgi:hypothetical protein